MPQRISLLSVGVFSTIVWASDGSESADRSLPWVARVAAAQEAMLWVVHVAQGPGQAWQQTGDEEEMRIANLKQHVRELLDDGFSASLYVMRESRCSVGAALAAAVRTIGADLVIVEIREPRGGGVPGRSAIADELVDAAWCPVLFIRPQPEARSLGSSPPRCAPTRAIGWALVG